jgi:hypothetical protein
VGEVHVPPGTLAAIRGFLDTAATDVEGTAGSAPTAVDGGDMTPLLTAMLATLVDNAATMSEGLTLTSAQVGDTDADFWTSDSDVASTFAGGGARVD